MSRTKEIDFIKSIAMIMIISGHGGVGIIYGVAPVHVMLFFMCSGFLIKNLKLKEQLLKNFQRLYLPFVGFSVVFIIFHNILETDGWHYTVLQHWYLVLEHTMLMDVTEPLLVPIWFLTALFLATIFWSLAKILDEYIDSERCMIISLRTVFTIIMAFLGINFTVSTNRAISVSFMNAQIVNVSLVGTVFLELGFLFKGWYKKEANSKVKFTAETTIIDCEKGGGERIIVINKRRKVWYDISGIICYVMQLLILNGCWGRNMMAAGVNVRENQYGNLFTYTLCLILIWHSLFVLGTWLSKSKILNKLFFIIGKNTLWIMAFHMLAFEIFENIVGYDNKGVLGYLKIIWGVLFSIMVSKLFGFMVEYTRISLNRIKKLSEN